MRRTRFAAVLLAAALIFTGAPQLAEPFTVAASAASSSKLAAPKNFKVYSKTSTSIKLMWNKVSGASAYRVYIYDKSQKVYKTYKSVTSTTCNVTGLSSSTTYKFKVAALVKKSGSYTVQTISSAISGKTESASSSGKLAAPKNFKGQSQKTTVTLTWDGVNGADGYRVYMYNQDKEKYDTYAGVFENKCTVKNLRADTKYKFKVAALVYKNAEYHVQTISSAITVKTQASVSDSSFPDYNVPTGDTDSAEFTIPAPGEKIINVLKNCGISNYKRSQKDSASDSANKTVTYVGDVIFGGILSEAYLTFDSQNRISDITITCPVNSTANFERAVVSMTGKIGSRPTRSFTTYSGDPGYSWVMPSLAAGIQYNSKLKYATISIDYVG